MWRAWGPSLCPHHLIFRLILDSVGPNDVNERERLTQNTTNAMKKEKDDAGGKSRREPEAVCKLGVVAPFSA